MTPYSPSTPNTPLPLQATTVCFQSSGYSASRCTPVHPPPCTSSLWRYADLCQVLHRQNYHLRGGIFRYDRQCEGEDPGQGRHPSGPATAYLHWQAAQGWPHTLGLQHPERVNPPPCSPSAWRYADLREDFDQQNDHAGS